MSQTNLGATKISQIFIKYCQEKNYQVTSTENADGDWRLDIATLQEKTIVTIYHTGAIVQGGPKNGLKEEFAKLISEFKNNPQSFLGVEKLEIKACVQTYNILLPPLRKKIKDALTKVEKATIEVKESPNSNIEYRSKIVRNDLMLTLTQYNNGTLLLQGKTDPLFDEICDLVDMTANPSDKDVISRFISCDEENLKTFAAKYTPELISIAENNVKQKIGSGFEYLEPYDKKWFVASECLCLTAIPLPEFSPLVMPASKAFEGFAKKLIVEIGLVAADHFSKKEGNFSPLSDLNNSARKNICENNKHVDTMLRKIDLCLKENRHFMMHSDDSKITKVDSQKEAEEKVNDIFKETKEIFNYFNDLFHLLPT